MDVNLDQLLSTVKLKEPQIAFLCKEILQGLAYIHEELHVQHGDVKPPNIFLTLNGQVKIGKSIVPPLHTLLTDIGNIAVSLLQNVNEDNSEDVKSVGRIIKEILEPGDSKKNPSSVALRNTDSGSDNIRTFISATQTSNLRNLLNVRTFIHQLVYNQC
jgi:serine/threonine protein kinase